LILRPGRFFIKLISWKFVAKDNKKGVYAPFTHFVGVITNKTLFQKIIAEDEVNPSVLFLFVCRNALNSLAEKTYVIIPQVKA
jgi:hypothetical protein